jgi:hypothetical protein
MCWVEMDGVFRKKDLFRTLVEQQQDKTDLNLQYIVYIETNQLIIPILLILDFNFKLLL